MFLSVTREPSGIQLASEAGGFACLVAISDAFSARTLRACRVAGITSWSVFGVLREWARRILPGKASADK